MQTTTSGKQGGGTGPKALLDTKYHGERSAHGDVSGKHTRYPYGCLPRNPIVSLAVRGASNYYLNSNNKEFK